MIKIKVYSIQRLRVSYPKYDNYDAIEVSRESQIPIDYEGVMGIPVSALRYLNTDLFDIVALRKNPDGTVEPWTVERERESLTIPSSVSSLAGLLTAPMPMIDGKNRYARILIQRRRQ